MDDDGPFFEDFRVGTEMRSKVGRTVTETDNVWFTLLTRFTSTRTTPAGRSQGSRSSGDGS